MIPPRFKYWTVGVTVLAALVVLAAISTGMLPRVQDGPAVAFNIDDKSDESRLEAAHYSQQENIDPHSDSGQTIRQEFEALMAGDGEIDRFILKHLTAAEKGNIDSAYYVSRAMMVCLVDLQATSLTLSLYEIDATDPDEISDLIMSVLVGTPEYYRTEAKRHIERAIACQRLGWDSQYHGRQSKVWGEVARDAGHPIALAKKVNDDPESVSPERLEDSRKIVRKLLQKNREREVFLAAGSVVSASTGRDYVFERLSWALLACEYNACDSLSFYYRSGCEVMTYEEGAFCSQDMTDMDYLFGKYPSQFDAARARAMEIKQAIDNSQWALLGLE